MEIHFKLKAQDLMIFEIVMVVWLVVSLFMPAGVLYVYCALGYWIVWFGVYMLKRTEEKKECIKCTK